MPVIRLGAPDGQNKLISVGFDHLEISTAFSKLCWLFCFQTIVCSTISRFWDGFRTTYYNNHCKLITEKGIWNTEMQPNWVFSIFMKESKNCIQNVVPLVEIDRVFSQKRYAFFVWIQARNS